MGLQAAAARGMGNRTCGPNGWPVADALLGRCGEMHAASSATASWPWLAATIRALCVFSVCLHGVAFEDITPHTPGV